MTPPIRVLIADDDDAMRRILADVIREEEDLELTAVASDANEAVHLALRHRPDVALLDVRMPGGGGPEAAQGIRAASPETRIVALSAYEDRAAVMWMLRAGATGYVLKGATVEEIVGAIRRAFQGGATLSSEVASGVIEELTGRLDAEADAAALRREQSDRIRRVLEERLLRVVLQPIFELETGRVTGVEALARFSAEPRQAPNIWFTEAAEVGLGPELEREAIRAALAHLPRIPRSVFLSLNASPEAAMDGVIDLVEPVAERVVVEVTEHAPVTDYGGLEHALRPFRAGGGRLAIDDAGAGFASLRHIVRLAPDIIKLDLSLTAGIDSHRTRRALARALISFAAELGSTVVAEGVATAAELATLRSLGVPLAQGFHLAPPTEVEELLLTLPVHRSSDGSEISGGFRTSSKHSAARRSSR